MHASIFNALKPPCACTRTSVCLVATGNVPDNGMGSNALNGGCCRGNRRGKRSIKRRAAPSLCRKSPHRDGYVTYSESNWDGEGVEKKRKIKCVRKLREYENRASFCGGNQSFFFSVSCLGVQSRLTSRGSNTSAMIRRICGWREAASSALCEILK